MSAHSTVASLSDNVSARRKSVAEWCVLWHGVQLFTGCVDGGIFAQRGILQRGLKALQTGVLIGIFFLSPSPVGCQTASGCGSGFREKIRGVRWC